MVGVTGGAEAGFVVEQGGVEGAAGVFVADAEVEVAAVGKPVGDEMVEQGCQQV